MLVGAAHGGDRAHAAREKQVERWRTQHRSNGGVRGGSGGWGGLLRRLSNDQRQRQGDDDDPSAERLQRPLPSHCPRQPHGQERHQRAADADPEIGEPHGTAARGREPARQQHLVRQRAAAHVAQRVEEIEKVEAGQRVDRAEPHKGDAGHQDPRRHQAPWAEPVHHPAGEEAEQRPDEQLRDGVSRGDLGAGPSEVAHHGVVEERQAVQRDPDDRKQRQE